MKADNHPNWYHFTAPSMGLVPYWGKDLGTRGTPNTASPWVTSSDLNHLFQSHPFVNSASLVPEASAPSLSTSLCTFPSPFSLSLSWNLSTSVSSPLSVLSSILSFWENVPWAASSSLLLACETCSHWPAVAHLHRWWVEVREVCLTPCRPWSSRLSLRGDLWEW